MSAHVSIERFNEALDGDLTAAELATLEGHVGECDVCRHEYARLSEVVRAVRGLPRNAETPPGVWAGIAARIANGPTTSESDDATVLELPTRVARPVSRRITLDVSQLAAAAIVVSVISAGTVWLALGASVDSSPETPQIATSATGGAAARAVSADGGRYGEVVDQLEQILAEGRSVLAPETVATIEASLTTVNAAIADVETALADDPGSDLLLRMLANHQRTKLGVLQRAASAVHART